MIKLYKRPIVHNIRLTIRFEGATSYNIEIEPCSVKEIKEWLSKLFVDKTDINLPGKRITIDIREYRGKMGKSTSFALKNIDPENVAKRILNSLPYEGL